MQLEGVYSVLPTPFTSSGDVDLDSLRRVVDLFIADGVNGFTALGVTSEVARLTEAERERVLDTVVDARERPRADRGRRDRGRDSHLHRIHRAAKAAGAAAVMISPPRMPKINSDAVGEHFAEVAAAVDIADHRAGLSADLRLRDGSVRCWRASRATCRPRARSSSKIRRRRSRPSRILEQTEGLDVRIFGGLGGVFLLEELMAGAAGAMTGFAFPAILVGSSGCFAPAGSTRRPTSSIGRCR